MNWNTPHNLLRSIRLTRMHRRHRTCLWNAPAPLVAFVACVAIEAASGAPPAMVGPNAGDPAPVLFTEEPGVKEFSGRLVARPRQPAAVEVWDGADPVPAAVRLRALQAIAELEIVQRVDVTDEFIVSVPAGEDENSLARRLLATGDFEYVTPDWRVWPLGCPNDSLFFAQWHHAADKLGSCQAWSIEQGSPSITIAICDTGIRASHVDLLRNRREAYNIVTGTWESQGGDISDIHGHGTWCTGTAAASGNDATGVTGVGWNLSHRMIRVSMTADGSSFMSTLTGAARLAADIGDRVVSVSYAGVADPSVGVTGAYVRSRNAMLVWAAGNESATLGGSRDDSLLVVGATDPNDSIAGFSNRGSFVDIVAPGVSIYTTGIGSDASWIGVNGTSFSCPMAAGLCGLIWSRNPSLSPAQVEQIIRASCTDLGAPGVDAIYGYGRIDSEAAMRSLADCDGNGIDDIADIANHTASDCNGNGVLDSCDIASGFDLDLNADGFPDGCQTSVVGWGAGTINTGDFPHYGQSFAPSPLGYVVAVESGLYHSVALRANGTVACWGWNNHGQSAIPYSGVKAIDAGAYHSVAILADDSVVCWGLNSDGQCNVPVALGPVKAIAGGGAFTIAVRQSGTLACWGWNGYGQCSPPPGLAAVADVAAGANHGLALRSDGEVVGWGLNDWGQSSVPADVGVAQAIAADFSHSVALRTDGTVRCWGYNWEGQCNTPVGLSDVVDVSAGWHHTVAVKRDGSVVAWGWDLFGQVSVPGGLNRSVSTAAGDHNSLALRRLASQPTAALADISAATCSLPIGAINVTVTDAPILFWSGPSGFTSTSEDLTGLAAGDYTLTASGPGGTTTLTVTVAAVPDMTAPVVTSYTASASAAADAACTATVPNLTSSVFATDNCTIASIIQTPLAGASVGLGTHEVTIRVTDAAGNNAAVTALFTVTGSPANYYADADHDGFGTGSPITACAQPANSASVGGDQCDNDPLKQAPGICGCGTPDTDANGNGIADCADVFLVLTPSATSVSSGGTLTVRVSASASIIPLSGVQLAMHFDASRLHLDAVEPVPGGPFGFELAEQADNAAGTLRYAAAIFPGDAPHTSAADLCDLHFTVLPGASLCGSSVLVTFGDVGPFVTRFVKLAGGAHAPFVSNLSSINLDSVPPVLAGVPSADISVPTDAGSTFGALVSLPTVTATDDCDGPVSVSVSGVPSDGIFPIGTTTVTWTATDAAGNSATASRTVTVEPYQLLDVSIDLVGFRVGASTRSIRVSVAGVAGIHDVSIPQVGAGTIQGIQVPVASGHACVAVKDTVHSLTRTAAPSVVGARYLAAVSLSQGDSNDDDLIEIVDYAMWIIDFGLSTPSGRSNFNGDAVVATADFVHIAIGFFTVGESCTPGADAPRTPRDRIHVKELRRMGLGELAAADLNHDGWVDTRDMQMCTQGARPPQPAAAASDAGGLAW